MKPPEKHCRQTNEASDDKSVHKDPNLRGETDNSIRTNSSSGDGNLVNSGETDDDVQDAESENSAGHKVGFVGTVSISGVRYESATLRKLVL